LELFSVWFFIFMSGKKERKKMNRFSKKSKLTLHLLLVVG
jgi:hypothetical protein